MAQEGHDRIVCSMLQREIKMSAPTLHVDRRALLGGVTALIVSSLAPWARANSPLLTISSRQLDVNGRAAQVFGVLGPQGRPGIVGKEGDRFFGSVLNATSEPLIMHWHGQVHSPAIQDRARLGGGAVAPGQSDNHDFLLTAGTHWMHAHQLTEQQLLAAPMVARELDAGDVQDVVVMLHDFAFRPPAEILAELVGGASHGGHGTGLTPQGSAAPMQHGGTVQNPANRSASAEAMPGMQMNQVMSVHANDVRYDAFLANDRTLDDPEIVQVERGGKVRLRIINGATATAFSLDTGALAAECVSVDGNGCLPHPGRRFPLAQGQRIDLLVNIPPSGGVFPILAQVEAERSLTGLILATPGASIERLSTSGDDIAPYADLTLDLVLRAKSPLSPKRADRMIHVMLGEEPGYRWTINGRVHGEGAPIEARLGERLEIMFMNPTSMMHPMHLHGHHFQVVGSRAGRFQGPLRDTVIVPPHTPVVVAVDLDKAGSWYLHCHHLYHMAAGMMADLRVS